MSAIIGFAMFVAAMALSSLIGRGLSSANPVAFVAALFATAIGWGGLGWGLAQLADLIRRLVKGRK